MTKEGILEKIKALVIDTSESSRSRLKEILVSESLDVFEADSRETGMELFRKHRPLIIIADLAMYGTGDLDVLFSIKRESPGTQVIFSTGSSQSNTPINALQHGAFDYISKPFYPARLRTIIGRAKDIICFREDLELPARLLVAEESEKVRQQLTATIAKQGYRVTEAGNREEALRGFQEQKIDLVLFGSRLSGKTSMNLVNEMRSITTDFESVLLADPADKQTAIEAMRSRMHNFLLKPVNNDMLTLVLEKALHVLRLKRSLRHVTHELELKKDVLAQVNQNKEIVLSSGNSLSANVMEYIKKLVNSIPISIALINKDMELMYINHELSRVFRDEQTVINEAFLEKLHNIGIKNLTVPTLKASVDKLIQAESGCLETLEVSKFGYINLFKIKTLNFQEESDYSDKDAIILLAMRGERP